MKKAIVFTLMLAFCGVGLMAQQAATPAQTPQHPRLTPEEKAKVQTDKLNGMVQLSPDQYAKVLEVNKNFITQREALRGQSKEDREGTHAKMEQLKKERDDKMKAILTPAQLKKAEEMRSKEMEKEKAEHREGNK